MVMAKEDHSFSGALPEPRVLLFFKRQVALVSPPSPFVSEDPTFTRPSKQPSNLPWKERDQRSFATEPSFLITVITPSRNHQKAGWIRRGASPRCPNLCDSNWN